MQKTAFLASRVCSFGKRLVFIVCKISPCTSSPSWPTSLANHLWQIVFSKMAPIPYVLLPVDLSTLPIKRWSPFLYLLNLDWPCDCLDQ